MLKLTKTGIGLLTRQYRSVLKKCWLLNLGIFAITFSNISDANSFTIVDRVYSSALGGYYFTNHTSDQYLWSTLVESSDLANYYKKTDKISIGSDGDGGNINFYDVNGRRTLQFTNSSDYGSGRQAELRFFDIATASTISTSLTASGFKLNGSTEMTGITHNTAVTANASSTVAKLVSESTLARSLNNYYRKEDLGSGQVIDFARYFKTGKFGENARFLGVINDNFATNLTSKIGGFATNHPPRLGAFAKCEKTCSRLSERYIAALGKNRAFEQCSRSARGTFLFGFQPNKNVMDSLSQNAQFMAVANDNFAIVTTSKVA